MQVIKECVDKLQIYFGASDGWAPLEYHYHLLDVIPKIDSRILDKKFQHCFMLQTAEELASDLSEHIENDMK